MIGAYVADELYGSAEKAYGETIKVNGYAFQIVGVMEQQDDTPEILQRRVMEQAEWKIMPQAIRLIAEGKVRVENGKTIITE